jgi:hypothetical protein
MIKSMIKNDKHKRDQGSQHFHFECAAPLDDVIKALMRLNQTRFLTQTAQDIQIHPTATGYQFRFQLYLTNSVTSEVEGSLWEDARGRVVLDGTTRRRYWAFLFWLPIILGGIGASVWFFVLSRSAALYNPDWSSYQALPLILLFCIVLLLIAIGHAFRHTARQRLIQALMPLQASVSRIKVKRLSLAKDETAVSTEHAIPLQTSQRLNDGR